MSQWRPTIMQYLVNDWEKAIWKFCCALFSGDAPNNVMLYESIEYVIFWCQYDHFRHCFPLTDPASLSMPLTPFDHWTHIPDWWCILMKALGVLHEWLEGRRILGKTNSTDALWITDLGGGREVDSDCLFWHFGCSYMLSVYLASAIHLCAIAMFYHVGFLCYVFHVP